MPTYEYACTACGQHVEVFQRFSEKPLSKCGACGGPLRKVFHPAGIVFKGSGFYATDNRSKKSQGESRSESSDAAPSKGEAKSEPKGEPKPPPKGEPKSGSARDSKSSNTKAAAAAGGTGS